MLRLARPRPGRVDLHEEGEGSSGMDVGNGGSTGARCSPHGGEDVGVVLAVEDDVVVPVQAAPASRVRAVLRHRDRRASRLQLRPGTRDLRIPTAQRACFRRPC